MQMVASKEIKYARRLKSLSGIFNKCFKSNIVLLMEAGPFLHFKSHLASRLRGQHIVMPTTGRTLLIVAPAVMISENTVKCRETGYVFTFIFI